MATSRVIACERAQGNLLGRPVAGPVQTAYLASRADEVECTSGVV